MPSPLWRTVRRHAARNGWEALESRTGAEGEAIVFARGPERLDVYFGPALPRVGIPFVSARYRMAPDADPVLLERPRDVLRTLEGPRRALRHAAASEVEPGCRVRRLGHELVVRGVRREPESSEVWVFTNGGRFVLRWDEVVEVLEERD
ncbi:MAG TPA: hypothetical protein VIB48_19575 [Acidimicrobiia bacterium]